MLDQVLNRKIMYRTWSDNYLQLDRNSVGLGEVEALKAKIL